VERRDREAREELGEREQQVTDALVAVHERQTALDASEREMKEREEALARRLMNVEEREQRVKDVEERERRMQNVEERERQVAEKEKNLEERIRLEDIRVSLTWPCSWR
jgi:hypothetical protein